jgi:hypothetical protein
MGIEKEVDVLKNFKKNARLLAYVQENHYFCRVF